MSKENEQLIAELEKQIGDLEAKIEKHEAEGGNADLIKELKASVETQKAALEKAEEALDKAAEEAEAKEAELAKAKDELAVEKAKGKMTDAERKCYDGMSDEKLKKQFLEMTPEQRVSKIADIAKNDEVVTIEGEQIRKSEVGVTQFAVLKKTAERLASVEKQATDEREKRITAELTKRASDEFPHLAGTTEEKVSVLKAIAGLDKTVVEAVEKIFKAAEATSKLAFEKLGHNAGGKEEPRTIEKAEQNFNKRVEDIRKANPKLSRTEALTKARTDFPDDFKAYQEAGNSAS